MMRKAFLVITVILGVVLCVYIWPVPMENMQISAGSNKLNGINWFTLSESAQERIVYDYVNALDSFAMAMPIVGGDTESAWAADTVTYNDTTCKGRAAVFLGEYERHISDAKLHRIRHVLFQCDCWTST